MMTSKNMFRTGSTRAKSTLSALVALLAFTPSLAHAQETEKDKDKEAEESEDSTTGLGLAPGIPQVGALAGGFAPAYAPGSAASEDWHPDFHGFLTMPLNIGFNKRAGAITEDQYKTVMHAPPMVPEYRDAFSYTSSLPAPYVQLHFAYGNSRVRANVILQARATATGQNYFDASTAGGISDAFVTFTPDLHKKVNAMIHVGAFTNRFGVTGQYDEGRYGTPLFARTNGVGENIVSKIELGDIDLELQHGFQGEIDKAPLGIIPGDWNEYADPNVGTSFAHHIHAGISIFDKIHPAVHYMNVWTADDRANMGTIPDGKINLIGGDVRLTLGRFGHLFVGGTLVDAKDARSVGRIVEVLNTRGGTGLMQNYLGPGSGGTGSLLIFGGQYDLSLARAIYGDLFRGQSPDIFLSAFGQRVSVKSDDALYDGVDKQKFGGEVTYNFSKWMGASFRFDSIAQDLEDVDESSTVLTPRLIFHSDWQSRDQVVLQYQKWINGDEVYVKTGTPEEYDPGVNPDEDVVTLSATMWW